MNNLLPHTLLATCMLVPPPAPAAAPCKAVSADCVVIGEWDLSVGVGGGARTNPIRGNSDIPLVVVPQVSYYGKRFFLENLELGVSLHEDATHTVNLIATPGYDRAFFVRNDLQNVFVNSFAIDTGSGSGFGAAGEEAPREFSVGRRGTTYLVGPEWIFRTGQLSGQLDALYEVTGRHDGYEVRAALAGSFLQAPSSLVVSGGLTWKSAELVRYYYGVADLYRPGSAANPFLKLGYSLPLSERWTLSAFAHYEHLDGAIADSPIVADGGVVTVFAGFVFKVL